MGKTMTNQFRNDGEMPPEIAVQFPVVNKRLAGQEIVKAKAKRHASEPPHKTLEIIQIVGVFMMVVGLLIPSAMILTFELQMFCGGLFLFLGGLQVLFMVARWQGKTEGLYSEIFELRG